MHSTPSASTAPPAFGYEPPRRDHEREKANVEIARRYLAAIEADTRSGSDGGKAVADFYATDAVQVELPNRFLPEGARRTVADIVAAGERGRKVLCHQRYEVKGAFAVGDSVILELLWVGTLAIAVGAIPVGGELRAHFAMFIEFERGRIKHQRNYDCFEPF